VTDTRAPRRTRARRGEGERLRGQILEAAERLLVEAGDEQAVTIRDVAEAVGVTPPSVYLHFADKDELLFAISERNFAELDRVTEEAAADKGSTEGTTDNHVPEGPANRADAGFGGATRWPRM
jgi:AcrR family transcriptional regulator